MNNEKLAEFDDNLIRQFETDWMNGEPNDVAKYLPSTTDSRFVGTLEELVHIDLEFRWKEFQKNNAHGNHPPSIEDYLKRFPVLEEVKLSLIQGEFELANQYGESPSVQQFVDRFGDNVGTSQLRPVLQSLLSEIQLNRVVKPGTTIGRYEINNEHGRGGFGAVWRATDTKLGRRIAVKQLGQRLATDAESRRRFISEARVTAKLEHPGIVPVYDISTQDDDYAYYTMRLIQGRTMAQAIDFLHQMDPKSAEFELLKQRLLQSFVDTCQTTHYAHSQGVIHRDLKPQNIIVGDFGETILLDWGLASVLDVDADPTESILLHSDPEVLTRAESIETLRGHVMGTPAYMPPEQARGEITSISRRSDVYSLGATLYHLITGAVPFTDAPLDELLERVKVGAIPVAHKLNPLVEKPLSAIAAKAMNVEAKDRYESASDLLQDVQKFLADQPVSAYTDTLAARASRWIRKNQTTAAMMAMTLMFSFLGVFAGLMINNAWQVREEKRITDLQIAAERADATAISQIQSGRFESAVETLGEASDLIQGETRLESFANQLVVRRDRTQTIVNFYKFSMQAQEETFFDRVGRSAAYCQSAVDQLGVLSNPDWWSSLPDDDLTALQAEQLRTEIYRILGLLASMRLAQTADDAFSFDILTDAKKVDPGVARSNLIRAAGFAASQGNRFRNARGLRIIQEVGAVAAGGKLGVDLTNINPLNSIDSAMMGSILDNNVPREGVTRTAISSLLKFRDPNEVAREWLNDGLKHNPDWYWLPIFIGVNQTRTGHSVEGIKTLSHAIGIRPDYWVGYQYRAWASVVAAQLADTSPSQKTTLLNSASLDVQRALDLAKNKSELHWIQAVVLSQNGASNGQINQTFLKAMSLRPKLGETGGHYSAISRMFFQLAEQMTNQQEAGEEKVSNLYQLRAVMLLWQDQHADAVTVCDAGLNEFPGDKELLLLKQLAQLDGGFDAKTPGPIEIDNDHLFAWHARTANAKFYRAEDDLENEARQLQLATTTARADWQQSQSRLSLAENYINRGQQDNAIGLIKEAIEIDRAVDLAKIVLVAREQGASDVESLCTKLQIEFEPKTQFVNQPSDIVEPALMNGGFELGLSYYWSPYAQRNRSATWNNFGKSKTLTEGSTRQPKSGIRCLAIHMDSPAESDSYGQMTQSVPVTPGVNYEVSFWARAEHATKNSIQVGEINPKRKQNPNSIPLDANSYDWKQFKFKFTAKDSSFPLSIVARGNGKVWLDDFKITKVGTE